MENGIGPGGIGCYRVGYRSGGYRAIHTSRSNGCLALGSRSRLVAPSAAGREEKQRGAKMGMSHDLFACH